MFFLPQSSHFLSSPTGVILLRVLAFLMCAVLLATSLYELPEQSTLPSGPQTLSGGVIPPKPKSNNESIPVNDSSGTSPVWEGLLGLFPDDTIESAKVMWRHGRDNQMAIVSVGLLTCLTAIFLAGPAR